MIDTPRDPDLADAFRDIVGHYDQLERVRLDQAETLATLSDYGALLALRWRLGLQSTASLLEVSDNLCLISDAEERDFSEALWARVATRRIAWRRESRGPLT